MLQFWFGRDFLGRQAAARWWQPCDWWGGTASRRLSVSSTTAALLGLTLVLVSSAAAQPPGGGGGGNQNNQNNAGIKIDARGVIAPAFAVDSTPRLDRKRQEALAAARLPGDVNTFCEARAVSLAGVVQAVTAAVERQEPIPESLAFLAGLQRIDGLFVDPDHQDLILVGPAEGFALDALGQVRGVSTGRPPLRLDDLIVALRSVPRSREVGCSIDPRPANLAALQQFLAQNSTAAGVSVIEARFRRMAEILGLHEIRVDGVPADSRFAQILVAADYRMKRISLGLENPGVKGLRSHLSLLGTGGNSLQRWWFVPLFDSLSQSRDGLAYEWIGPRAQLLSQEELSNASGERSAAPTTRATTQAFAKIFTEKFPELADAVPVFAELQNLIDWCVVAAVIEKDDLVKRSGWSPGILLDAGRLPHASGPTPKEVPAMVNSKRVGSGSIVGLVAGGVTIGPRAIVNRSFTTADPSRRLEARREATAAAQRPASHPWWWD